MVTRCLGLFSTLVLVRLLAPSDFGLVVIAFGFAQSIDALSNLGVQEALIREREPSDKLYHTAFTLNVVRALLTALIIAVAAGPAAGFFSEPRLEAVLLVLAVLAALGGVENIAVLDFRRELSFHKEFKLLVLPRFVQVAMTLFLALWWKSYWALIAGFMIQKATSLSLGYLMRPYRPRLTLSEWRTIAAFSFWSWLITIALMVRGRADSMIIGRSSGLTDVGIYSIGNEIGTLPSTEIVAPLCRACFASFSLARRTDMNAVDIYLRTIAAAALITIPASIGIMLLANPLVALALGPMWMAAVPVVQVFSLVCIVNVFGDVSATLFDAYAYLRSNLKVLVLSILIRIVLVWVLLAQWGLVGAAVGAALSMAFEQIAYILLAFRRFHLQWSALAQQIWRPSVAATGMAAVLIASGLTSEPAGAGTFASLSLVLAASVVGALVYFALITALWLLAGQPKSVETDVIAAMRLAGQRLTMVMLGSKTTPTAPKVG